MLNKMAYILAASHSGSTLLAMLLGAQPGACTVGELKFSSMGNPEKYRCSCGEPIIRCDFWNTVKQVLKKKGFELDFKAARMSIHDTGSAYIRTLLKPMCRGIFLEALRDAALSLNPLWHYHMRNIQMRIGVLVETLSEISGANVIVDSSKRGLRLKYLLKNKNLDVRVIRLIRDGRAVALTYLDPCNFADASNPQLRAGGFGGNRESERMSMEKAAFEWFRNVSEAEYLLQRLKKTQWIEIRYEELCADPDATLSKASAFLGLSNTMIVRDFRSTKQHVIGNGMRFNTTTEVCQDERWKTQLTKTDLRIFDSIAGAMNRKYGYT